MTLSEAQADAYKQLRIGDMRSAVLIMCRWANDPLITELGLQVLWTGDETVIRDFIRDFMDE